jgi:hypothetical protein
MNCRATSFDEPETTMRSPDATFGAVLCAALTAVSVLGAGPAAASIRITDSHYANGVLIVGGQVEPNQRVTLDRKYNTKSDADGHFEFRESYKPDTCMSDVTAGTDSYSTLIEGCLMSDAAEALHDPADASTASAAKIPGANSPATKSPATNTPAADPAAAR